jgi:hypothetical protein
MPYEKEIYFVYVVNKNRRLILVAIRADDLKSFVEWVACEYRQLGRRTAS